MSFQAYLDDIEAKTGKAPEEFIQLAGEKGYDESTESSEIVAWLQFDFQLEHDHAMALVHVIKHGIQISDRHVGSAGPHRNESEAPDESGKEDQ